MTDNAHVMLDYLATCRRQRRKPDNRDTGLSHDEALVALRELQALHLVDDDKPPGLYGHPLELTLDAELALLSARWERP